MILYNSDTINNNTERHCTCHTHYGHRVLLGGEDGHEVAGQTDGSTVRHDRLGLRKGKRRGECRASQRERERDVCDV